MTHRTQSIALIALLLSLTAASTALADDPFSGPYVVFSNETRNASVRVDEVKIKSSEAMPVLGAGYTLAVDQLGSLGISATFDHHNSQFGAGKIGGADTIVKTTSHYALAFEPGWMVNEQLLMHGILAYHIAKPELVSDGTSTSFRKISGFGYGLGLKYALPNRFFLSAQLQKIDYNSKLIGVTTIKPESTVMSVGIGYRF